MFRSSGTNCSEPMQLYFVTYSSIYCFCFVPICWSTFDQDQTTEREKYIFLNLKTKNRWYQNGHRNNVMTSCTFYTALFHHPTYFLCECDCNHFQTLYKFKLCEFYCSPTPASLLFISSILFAFIPCVRILGDKVSR